MSFSDLTEAMQTIESYNFEMTTRIFWIFIMVAFALFYEFYWRPNFQKKTPFFSLATIQGSMHIFSIVLLIASPLLFLAMSPTWDVWSFVTPFLTLYIVHIIIYVIAINIDLIQLGIPVLLKMGGIDSTDPRVNQVYNRYFNKNGRNNR